MKVRFQRCFSLALLFMLCGVFVVPARANIVDDVVDGVKGFYDSYFTLTSPLYRAVKPFLPNPDSPTEEELRSAYNDYVEQINSQLGTTVVGRKGFVLPVRATGHIVNDGLFVSLVPGPPSYLTVKHPGSYMSYHMLFSGTAPVTGTYTLLLLGFGPVGWFLGTASDPDYGGPIIDTDYNRSVGLVAGDPFSFKAHFYSSDRDKKMVALTASYAFLVEPVSYPGPDDFTSDYGGSSARPGGDIDVKFGIQNGDGTVIVADKIKNLFIEQTNQYYNPRTETYVSANDWYYDYSTRQYIVEAPDNEKVNVTYGDDVVTMVIEKPDGSKDTYIYSYLAPNSTPSPGPSPSPGPDDGGGDGDGDNSGIFGWLGDILDGLNNIWKTLKGVVSGIVDGLLDGLSSLLTDLFSPSEEAVDKLNTEVDTKLPLIGDLQSLGDDLVSTLENPGKSVKDLRMTTVVDLGKGSGQIKGAGQINLLDVSWYMEYKPLVDDIIIGFVWLVFLWNLYGALPSIIHGGASALHTTSEIRKGADYYSGGRHGE